MEPFDPTLADLIKQAKGELQSALLDGGSPEVRNLAICLGILYDKQSVAPEADQRETPVRYSYHVEAFDADDNKFRLDLLDGTSLSQVMGAAEAIYTTRPEVVRVMLVIRRSDRPGWETRPVPRPPAVRKEAPPTEPLFPHGDPLRVHRESGEPALNIP